MSDIQSRAVGVGIALGAGVGSTTATVAGGDVTQGATFGIGGGIVVGAMVALLAERVRDGENPGLSLVVGGLVAGLAVGGLLGAVSAWSVDAGLAGGVQAGGAGGAVLGLLVAGILGLSLEESA